MAPGLAALADGAECVVLHDRGAADPAQKTLLHAALELEDGDLGRWLWWELVLANMSLVGVCV